MATTPVNGKNNPLGNLPGPMPSDAASGASKANGLKTAEANLNRESATGGGKSPPNFNVNISDSAKDRADASQKALNIARNTPDIREDKVAALKAQIDAGTYKVDAGKVADGMMREAIKEHLSEIDER
jgi:negative regulator of flagellin synthesis FlgM